VDIIEIKDLKKSYLLPGQKKTTFYAVNKITLSIGKGEIYGILGPNGAGKTTTLEMLEGLKEIDSGSVFIDGVDVSIDPFSVKKVIGVQLQSNEYFDKLDLSELLTLFSKLYSTSVDNMELLDQVDLLDKAHSKTQHLSGGQRQRFSIACALVNNPKILFLDEPTTGLDPQAKRNLWRLVKDLNSSGMTVVLTTHNMEEAEYLCDRIAIMDKGRLIAEDTPSALIEKYAPEPSDIPVTGNIEDVFLNLTGHSLRD